MCLCVRCCIDVIHKYILCSNLIVIFQQIFMIYLWAMERLTRFMLKIEDKTLQPNDLLRPVTQTCM